MDRMQVGEHTVTTNREEAKQNQKQVTGTLLFIGLCFSQSFSCWELFWLFTTSRFLKAMKIVMDLSSCKGWS